MSDRWRTIDFRPAPAGWRLAMLVLPELATRGFELVDLPGWLVQEDATDQREPDDRDRRVVAAYCDAGELIAADELANFWYVLSPNGAMPGPGEAARELRRRGGTWAPDGGSVGMRQTRSAEPTAAPTGVVGGGGRP